MRFTVDKEVVNKLFAFLGAKPYVEVHEIIKLLQDDLDKGQQEKEDASKGKEAKSGSKATK